MKITNLTVYCGSSRKCDPLFYREACALGKMCAERGINVIYGGGNMGLMGSLADGVLEHGGTISAVIPKFMVENGWCHTGLTSVIEVDTMHERKAEFIQRADAFVVLPGSIGTLEELSEVIAWKKLDIHPKPIAILNFNGFYDILIQFLDHLVEQKFMTQKDRENAVFKRSLEEIFSYLKIL